MNSTSQSAVSQPALCDETSTEGHGIKNTGYVKKRRHTGVGVLIVTEYMGAPYIVLGREEFKSIKQNGQYMIPLYEEFGGGIQRRKQGLELNACFELREETCNLLNFTECPDVLLDGVNRYVDIPFRDDRMYRLYVIYIPKFANILPQFYQNRACLQRKKKYPGGRINTYLEMDDIKLVSLDAIKEAARKSSNYICFNHEDTQWNYENNLPYRGTLRVDDDTFISERLCQFLNNKHDNKIQEADMKIPGLDICYQIHEAAYEHEDKSNKSGTVDTGSLAQCQGAGVQLNSRAHTIGARGLELSVNGIIQLNKPTAHIYNPLNTYDNFLLGTYYYAPDNKTPIGSNNTDNILSNVSGQVTRLTNDAPFTLNQSPKLLVEQQ